MLLRLAERDGAGTAELKEAVGDVSERTRESDLAYLRSSGAVLYEPGKRTRTKWGRPSFDVKRTTAGRPSANYWLVNLHDQITSDKIDSKKRRKLILTETKILDSHEFRDWLENEMEAAIKFIKMTPQIVDSIRPFRKYPAFRHLLNSFPPSDTIHVDYRPLDLMILGEFADREIIRMRITVPEEYLPWEAAFRLRFIT